MSNEGYGPAWVGKPGSEVAGEDDSARTDGPDTAELAWEPLRVPTMDSIRRLVSQPGASAWPNRGDWDSPEVFQVVQVRWRRALRETCTHPHGFRTSLATNLFGEPRIECPRCYQVEPDEPDTEDSR